MKIDEVQKRYRKWVDMNKYERVINQLEILGCAHMKVFGNSMLPIIKSGSRLYYETREAYEKGDIVFCKIGSKFIDAHKITKVNKKKGYMISNNNGHDNGWTKTIYGKVVKSIHNKTEREF